MESLHYFGNGSHMTTTEVTNVTTTIDNLTTAVANVTTAPPPTSDIPHVWGFVAAGGAVLFFGSNFVPIKKFETGDGMFFQWVLCGFIWLTGLVINCIRHFPPFYPLAMLGGFLWATGNVTVVPIIKTIGLSKGILVWGSFNLLAGWTSGRFGLFGLDPEVPNHLALNYAGMGLCLVSAVVYLFIQSESQTHVDGGRTEHNSDPSEHDPLLPKPSEVPIVGDSPVMVQTAEVSRLDRLSPRTRGIVGTVMAVVAGVLYGLNFTPVIYIQDNYKGASQNGLDYVFSHFCGIYATSSAYFVLYCSCMCNRPKLYPRAILPAVVSGIMWAVADAAWFVANAVLSEAVSFPIITAGPGIVGALWGIILFKEIKGLRNILLVFIAACIAIAGSILTGFSKG